MTRKRPSYSKKNALRYLSYFETLLAQVKSSNPQGMFLKAQDFNNIGVATLQNRFTDALKWLTENNITEGVDRRQDFLLLRASMRTRKEEFGLRIMILSGASPNIALRPAGGTPEQAQQPADYKVKVQEFLESTFNPDEPVREFNNCLISAQDSEWLKKMCDGLGALSRIDGDRIVIVRTK